MDEILNGIHYDKETGIAFSSRKRGTILTKSNLKELTQVNNKGYIMVWSPYDLSYKLLHRVIVEYYYGPIDNTMVIDHIDGNRTNNALNNLRLTTISLNNGKALPKYNSTGFAGVTKTKSNRYQAKIKVNSKSISLGTYDTPREAYEHYKKAKEYYFGEEALLYLN